MGGDDGPMPPSPCLPLQVNTAARMETTSEPGRVHLSESAANILLRSPVDDLVLVARGSRTIKGKVRRRRGARLSFLSTGTRILQRELGAVDPGLVTQFSSFQGVMSTYFLAARDGGPGRADDPSNSELATAGAADALATGAVGIVAFVAASARPRAVPRPPPRRNTTLADLRLRLRSIEDSAAEQLSRGSEAAGGGSIRGSADGGNVGGSKGGSPLAASVSPTKRDAAAYTVAGEDGGSAGGSLSGLHSIGGSHTGTTSLRRQLTSSVFPAAGIGPPRRPSVVAAPEYSE